MIPTNTLLIILLVVLIFAVLPAWPHSRNWGYSPVGVIALVLIVLLIMTLL